MSFNLTSRRHRFERPAWSGTAFLVEALVLLVFLAACVAVFVQLYTHAASQASESRELSHAVAAATDVAERFAADPTSVAETTQADGLVVTCARTEDNAGSGTLYKATISVWDEEALAADNPAGAELAQEPIYSITTARFVGGEGR